MEEDRVKSLAIKCKCPEELLEIWSELFEANCLFQEQTWEFISTWQNAMVQLDKKKVCKCDLPSFRNLLITMADNIHDLQRHEKHICAELKSSNTG